MLVEVTNLKDYSDDRGNSVITSGISTRAKVLIAFGAKGCRILLAEGVKIQGWLHIRMEADNGEITVGTDSILNGCYMRTGLDSQIKIGSRLWMTKGGNFSSSEGTTLEVGDDCMFAEGVVLRTDHSHPIFHRKTLSRLNPSVSARVGDHVWLGPSAYVYPGAQVGEGSVVGARSIVTKRMPANCVMVGAPAKVVRKNIVWDSAHISKRHPRNFPSSGNLELWQSSLPIDDENEGILYRLARRLGIRA